MRSRHRRPGGAMVVEFSLVSIVFFLFFFGIIEYGRFAFTRNLAYNAAREGARLAKVRTTSDEAFVSWSDATKYPGPTTGDTYATRYIQDHVDSWLVGQGINQWASYDKYTSITIYRANPTTLANAGTWTKAGFGDPIVVEINGTWNSALLSFIFFGNNPVINVKALEYCEANL